MRCGITTRQFHTEDIYQRLFRRIAIPKMPSCRATTAKGHRCRLPAIRAKVGGNPELLNCCRHHIQQLNDFFGSPVKGKESQATTNETEPDRPILQCPSPTASSSTSANVRSDRPTSPSTSRQKPAAAALIIKTFDPNPSPPTPQERSASSPKSAVISLPIEVDLIPSTFGLGSSSPLLAGIRPGPSPPVTDALPARPEPSRYFATPSRDKSIAKLPSSSPEIVIYLDYQPSTQMYQRTFALRSIESDQEYTSNADRGRRHSSAPPDVSRGFCRKRIDPPLPRYITPVKKRDLKRMSWWQGIRTVM